MSYIKRLKIILIASFCSAILWQLAAMVGPRFDLHSCSGYIFSFPCYTIFSSAYILTALLVISAGVAFILLKNKVPHAIPMVTVAAIEIFLLRYASTLPIPIAFNYLIFFIIHIGAYAQADALFNVWHTRMMFKIIAAIFSICFIIFLILPFIAQMIKLSLLHQ